MGPGQNFVDWDDKYSTGIPLVDEQHKHLIDITNELHRACLLSDNNALEQFRKTVHETVAYVKYHFSTEEQVMEKTDYPGLAEHKKIHAKFAKEVLQIAVAFEEGKKLIANQFVRFLRDWVLSHVAIDDSKMGDFIIELQKNGKLGKITMRRKNDSREEKKIVLAIDNSREQLSMFKTCLSGMCDVYTCESTLRALEMVKRMEVDIMLLEPDMPEINCFEFLQRLRSGQKQRHIPVIVVSGRLDEKFMTTLKKSGANDFIAKPLDPELLKQKILQQFNKN